MLAEALYEILPPLQVPTNPNANIPAELVRRYDVVVRPQAKARPLRLREVSADHIGRLVTLQVGLPLGPPIQAISVPGNLVAHAARSARTTSGA